VQAAAVVGIQAVVVDELSAIERPRTPRHERDAPGSPARP
jgi:hypothetical protein